MYTHIHISVCRKVHMYNFVRVISHFTDGELRLTEIKQVFLVAYPLSEPRYKCRKFIQVKICFSSRRLPVSLSPCLPVK